MNIKLQPYRIGAMVDLPGIAGLSDAYVDALRFAFEEAFEKRIIDRPVEVVVREYAGQPWTDARTNVEVMRALVEQENVLGIAGPMTTDNSLAVLGEVERLGVPTITICGTQLFVGRYAFNLSNGGMGDEPAVIGAWLRANGLRRAAIIKDAPSQIGEEYCQYFRYTAQVEDLLVVSELGVSPEAEQDDVTAALKKLRESNPDALVYFGLGLLPGRISDGLKALGWEPPRIMCTAFCGATYNADFHRGCIGWVGVDQFDERNEVLKGVVDRFRKAKNRDVAWNSATSCGYDTGRAFALGLARMRITSRDALRDAMETIRFMPAATGAPGTVITFGPQDHRGFKGLGYLVLRKAHGQGTELVGVAPI
ncbi:MAG: ABC transporter substrate-binding protein [Gammaproteobacteria bacterium]